MRNGSKFHLVRTWRAVVRMGWGQLCKREKSMRGAGVVGPGGQPRSLNSIWKVTGSRKRFKKGTDRSGLHFRKATQAVP